MGAGISTVRMSLFVLFAMPVVALTAPVAIYLPAYYVELGGLSLTEIGLAFFVLRIFDLVTDIAIGVSVDASPWRSGKYKPWIILSIPLVLLGVWLMFMPNGENLNLAYIIGCGFIMYLGYTLANLVHQAWGADLFARNAQVQKFFGLREVAVIAGILIALGLPAIVETRGAATLADKVNAMAWFLIIAIPSMGILSLLAMKDVPSKAKTESSQSKFSLKGLGLVFRQPKVLRIALSNLFWFFALMCGASISPFLVMHALELGDYFARAQGTYFIVAFGATFIWLFLARQFGQLETLRIAVIFAIVAHLSIVPAMVTKDVTFLFFHFILSGVSFGAGPFLIRAMAANLASSLEDENDTEVRGVLLSLILLTDKFGGALAVGLALPLLEWLSFVADGDNTPEALENVMNVYLFLPILGYMMVLLCLKASPERPVEKSLA